MAVSVVNNLVQAAMKKGSYFPTKKDGKLLGFRPIPGQLAIFEDEQIGTVLRSSNGVGDFVVQMTDGTKVRKNLCNSDILGYINP